MPDGSLILSDDSCPDSNIDNRSTTIAEFYGRELRDILDRICATIFNTIKIVTDEARSRLITCLSELGVSLDFQSESILIEDLELEITEGEVIQLHEFSGVALEEMRFQLTYSDDSSSMRLTEIDFLARLNDSPLLSFNHLSGIGKILYSGIPDLEIVITTFAALEEGIDRVIYEFIREYEINVEVETAFAKLHKQTPD